MNMLNANWYLRIMTFSKRYFRYIFFFLIIAKLLILNKLNEHSEMLVSRHSPRGIVSLELSLSQVKQDSILYLWSKASKMFVPQGAECAKGTSLNGTEVAWTQNNWDHLFIVFYVLIFILVAFRLYLPGKSSKKELFVVIITILIAGLLDYIEDLSIYAALIRPSTRAYFIWLPALLKFVLLICIGLYFFVEMYRQKILLQSVQFVSGHITATCLLIWNFRIATSCLLVLFLALWTMDQGRDLLLIINSNWIGPVSFLTAISILALLNWYLSKLYIPKPVPGVLFRNYFFGLWRLPREMNKNQLDGARLLGALTFLLPMICLLNAMRIFGIPYSLHWINPIILLVSILVIFQLAMYYNWINRFFAPFGKINLWRFVILILTVLTLILFPLSSSKKDQPYFLSSLALDLFSLAIFFLVYCSIRTCNWGFHNIKKYSVTPWVVWPGVVLTIIFLMANISPRYFYFNNANRLFTLPMIIASLCFYNITLSFVLLKDKIFRVQSITFVLVAGIIISSLRDNQFHQVNTVKSDFPISKSDTLSNYIESWLNKRLPEIASLDSNSFYPVFFVNAYGGGIRAAIWPTFVISTLDNNLVSRGHLPFQHYAFSYSGASGGTVGLSELVAARYFLGNTPSIDRWANLYRNDFLTPEIIALFGRDAWSSSFGINWYDDRSVLQEHEWTQRIHELDSLVKFDLPFLSYWNSRGVLGPYEIPLLFSNTYLVDSGLKAIIAPVRLKKTDFPGSMSVEDLFQDEAETDIRLSTAAILSARFLSSVRQGNLINSITSATEGLKKILEPRLPVRSRKHFGGN